MTRKTARKTKRQAAPKFPSGKLIKVEAIEVTRNGRLRRVKIREKELKKIQLANPRKRKPAKRKTKANRKRR